jgi:fatty-acyl-CoA synthase
MHVPLLVNDFLQRAARSYPDKLAVVDGGRRFTYDQLQRRVHRLSNALLELGVRRGDRVCILSPNSHYFLESFYATSQIGAILVPLNYRLVAADHEYILNHAEVGTVLVDWEYTAVIDEIRPRLRSVRNWIVARHEGTLAQGWSDWETLLAATSEDAPEPVDLEENEVVSINYTSGTTARPKGVMLTHRNCYLNAYNLIAHLGIRHDDVELWTLPMFHCNGWGGVYALTGMAGTHVVLRSIDARLILDYPDKAKHAIRTRPRFTVAGAPPPAAFVERLEKELGWQFIEIYGLTETAPLLTVNHPDHYTRADDWARRARAGVPAIGVAIEVRGDDGALVPRDGASVGEVCARTNVVFEGYWRQPEETAKAIVDGWFHTGDLGVWDRVGNVHIVDRKKDVIISGGENISSAEIEDALYQHPAVLECAVIGVPHPKWGETPKALVVLRAGQSLAEDDVIAFCRDRLAHFKCPTSVEFLPELPRTATGKLQKFKLRERYWQGTTRRVN